MKEVTNPRVPWSGRGHKYTPEEVALVAEVMQSADPLTQGKHQLEFQRRFAEYVGSPHAFAMSSATAALELSAMMCRLKPGDEVIIPAHTFAATAIPFGRTGARIVWADLDPKTWVVTAETIKPLITPRTKAVVVVHLYGLVCDMDPILELARGHGIKVVEDAAQALGARYKGRAQAGTMGDFGCYSFHSHKNMTTLGEGGMLTLKDAELAKVVPGLRHNGGRPFSTDRELYWVPAMSNVDFDWEGVWPYNFCIGEVQCALGTKLLERIDRVNESRRKRGLRIRESLAEFPELVFQRIPEGCESVHHLLPVKYEGGRYGKTRDDLMKLLAFEYGVKAVVQYYPLYRYPLFQRAGFGAAQCPATDQYFDSMLSLPFQDFLSEQEIDVMVEALRASCARLRR